MQRVIDVEPLADQAPDGQDKHNVELLAALVPEYFPAGHKLHAAEPIASLYLPLEQASHGPLSGPVYPVMHLQAESKVLPTAAVVVNAGHLRQLVML
jgi:hypothetical protein